MRRLRNGIARPPNRISPRGENSWGACYLNGEGVAKREMEAVKWFRKAAEQNYVDGQFNLGMCYEEVDLGTEDWAEVYEWLSLAATQGTSMPRSS